jgi:hypothetical protein
LPPLTSLFLTFERMAFFSASSYISLVLFSAP